MRRRTLVLLLGAAALSPLVARAQPPRVPVVGYLHSGTQTEATIRDLAAFRKGLAEAGFVDGRNVRIDYRGAQNRLGELPALARDLVRIGVDVIYTLGGVAPAMAAKTATSTIPIVFTHGSDPVKAGLVGALNRPGGNVTGVSLFTGRITAKRLELLREVVPKAAVIAVLVNPRTATGEARIADVESAARSLGLKTRALNAASASELDAAFATLDRQRADGLLVIADPMFRAYRKKIVALAGRYAIPAIHGDREVVQAGGLMSYGAEIQDVIRQGGVYVGRILKGEKPAELPVLLPTRFRLAINLKTAKALGLAIPSTLLALADEVIE